MRHRLKTREGKAIYARRKSTVETDGRTALLLTPLELIDRLAIKVMPIPQ